MRPPRQGRWWIDAPRQATELAGGLESGKVSWRERHPSSSLACAGAERIQLAGAINDSIKASSASRFEVTLRTSSRSSRASNMRRQARS